MAHMKLMLMGSLAGATFVAASYVFVKGSGAVYDFVSDTTKRRRGIAPDAPRAPQAVTPDPTPYFDVREFPLQANAASAKYIIDERERTRVRLFLPSA